MDLLSILTIAAKVMDVAVGMAQDGRQQATAGELAQLRAVTQLDIAAVEEDVAGDATSPQQ